MVGPVLGAPSMHRKHLDISCYEKAKLSRLPPALPEAARGTVSNSSRGEQAREPVGWAACSREELPRWLPARHYEIAKKLRVFISFPTNNVENHMFLHLWW